MQIPNQKIEVTKVTVTQTKAEEVLEVELVLLHGDDPDSACHMQPILFKRRIDAGHPFPQMRAGQIFAVGFTETPPEVPR